MTRSYPKNIFNYQEGYLKCRFMSNITRDIPLINKDNLKYGLFHLYLFFKILFLMYLKIVLNVSVMEHMYNYK